MPTHRQKARSNDRPSHDGDAVRIGLLFRGDRSRPGMSPRAEATFAPLFGCFTDLGATAEAVVYDDDHVDDVRDQLLGLDGVIVWVNPIQDGADRSHLDPLLRDVADKGVWVSAHPDMIMTMGTKEVLYRTRTIGWSVDTDLYDSAEDFTARFPACLGRDRVRVLKQGRGNGGNGVWSVALLESGPAALDAPVRVRHAMNRDGAFEDTTLGEIMQRCVGYFDWSGCIIDQAFVDRLGDGMVRCYFVQDQVAGFCHQWPKGLLASPDDDPPAPRPIMEPPETPAYRVLKTKVETDWLPAMKQTLGLERQSLPVIWDADFLYGPKTEQGDDTYVLCEINVSAVWPYPPDASPALAKAAVEQARANRAPRR